MDGDVLVAAFRLGTQRLGPWGHGTRYPAALREKAVEYLRARRGTGVPVSMIASELGVGSGTLLRWASEPASSGPTFVPVKMVGSQTPLRGEPVPLPHEVAHDQPVVTRLG